MFISRAHASERAPTYGPAGAEAKTKPKQNPGTYGRGQDALQGGVTKEGNQRTGPRPGRIITPSRSTAEETPAAAFAGAKGATKIKRDKGGPSHEKCLSGTSQIRVRPALYSKRISEPTKASRSHKLIATGSPAQPAPRSRSWRRSSSAGHHPAESVRENIRRSSARGFGSPHKCSRPAQR